MVYPSYHLRLNHDPHWNMERPHFHDAYEIYLPLSDEGNFFLNDKVYPLHRGTLFIVSEATLHRTVVEGNHKRFVLYLPPKTLRELSTAKSNFYQLMQHKNHCVLLDPAQTDELAELFETLHKLQDHNEFGDDLRCTIALLNILLKANSLLEVQNPGTSISSKDFQRVAPILEYIQENLSQPLTLDRIAEQFYINKHYLCHLFKSATGFSVIEYVIANRVLKARKLLQEGYSVQNAGEQAGFSSNSHFIRTFKEMTGTSPGRYAKEHAASDKI